MVTERPESGRGADRMAASDGDEESDSYNNSGRSVLSRVFNPYGGMVLLRQGSLLRIFELARQSPGKFSFSTFVPEIGEEEAAEKKKSEETLFEMWRAQMDEAHRRAYESFVETLRFARLELDEIGNQIDENLKVLEERLEEFDKNALRTRGGRMVLMGPRGYYVDENGVALSPEDQEWAAQQDQKKIKKFVDRLNIKKGLSDGYSLRDKVNEYKRYLDDLDKRAAREGWTEKQIRDAEDEIRRQMGLTREQVREFNVRVKDIEARAELENVAQAARREGWSDERKNAEQGRIMAQMSDEGAMALSTLDSFDDEGDVPDTGYQLLGRTPSFAGVVDGQNGIRGDNVSPVFQVHANNEPAVEDQSAENTVKSGGQRAPSAKRDEPDMPPA